MSNDNVADVLQALDGLPAAVEALDASAIDGFLTGVVLQRLTLDRLWRHVVDPEGRAPAIAADEPSVTHLLNLLESRRRQLDRAIEQRIWFDPWVFEADADAPDPVRTACAPWAAGLALALEHTPGPMALDSPVALAALALIYAYFDPGDLEDADELLAAIEEIEPARDLTEAVEDLVTGTLRLADVCRPQVRRVATRRGQGPGRARTRR